MKEIEKMDLGGCTNGGHHIHFPGKAATVEQSAILALVALISSVDWFHGVTFVSLYSCTFSEVVPQPPHPLSDLLKIAF